MTASSRRTIAVDGITLAYEEYGQGYPIIFIHGIAASSYSWRAVAKTLSDSYRCICFDLMGFGDSDKPGNESYSLKRQAELMLKAIHRIGIERYVLAGHSLGGGVCLSMMHELGESHSEITGLILVDSACYLQKIPIFIRALRIPILPIIAMKLIPAKWGFALSAGDMYIGKWKKIEAIAEYSRSLKLPGAHKALIATAKEIVPPDIEEFTTSYSKIAVPTQVIWAEYDKVIPLEQGQRLAEDIPSAKLNIIEGCGHCPQEELPEETAQVIRAFADKL